MKKFYKIIRLINNNVVMCKDIEEKRCMVIGKGIGFKKKPQDIINDVTNIEKVYYLIEENNIKTYNAIMDCSKDEVVGAVEEAITIIEEYVGKPISENIHITLLDHINFAISRIENKINIRNPLLHEIKFLYTEEFLIAEKVVDFINETLKSNLPYDEVGFIAMHIHASVSQKDIGETSTSNNILGDTISFIEKKLGQHLDKNSLSYFRFLTHLRFSIDRALNGKNVENLLIDTIKDKFGRSYQLAEELSVYIYDKYRVYFNDGEVGYIALHLQNIVNERENNNYTTTW